MATTTDNGWPASPKLKTRVIEPVKGVRLRIVDNANVASVFTYLVQNYHKRVDDVTKPHPHDDWGFSFRDNKNNPHALSRHAGGIAIDLDATEHPNGVSVAKTFTSKQIAEVHKILAELKGVVRWGGDYHHTIDGMHFEINVRPGGLKTIGAELRAGKIGPHPTVKRKTTSQIADEVIAGKWGNAPVRKKRLEAKGYNYAKVQAAVKAKLAARKKH